MRIAQAIVASLWFSRSMLCFGSFVRCRLMLMLMQQQQRTVGRSVGRSDERRLSLALPDLPACVVVQRTEERTNWRTERERERGKPLNAANYSPIK